LALIDEAKTALRVSTNDAGITAQIQRLIEEAKLDLCRTADISESTVSVSEPDALIKGAILCYVGYVWTTDADEKNRLKACYDDYKAKLAMSSAYGTYSGE
jgi:hypothetical protein